MGDSQLILSVANNNEGLLSEALSTEQKAEVDSALQQKVTNGEITEEEYNTLMKLFNAPAQTE